MREVGVIYGKGYAFPRVHVECDFRLAMVHDDLIEIEVSLTKLGKSSMTFEFRTLRAGDLAASGAVVVVCMDATTQRSRPIPEDLREKLAAKLRGTGQSAGEGD